MECEGATLGNTVWAQGATAEANDPYWLRLFSIGPPVTPLTEDMELELIGEEGSVTGEVFGDGSVVGKGVAMKGGSAFGALKSGVEKDSAEVGDQALRGAWVKLEGEDHSSTDAELNAFEKHADRGLSGG